MKILKFSLILTLVLVTALYGFTTIRQNITGKDVAPQIHCDADVLEISVKDPESALLADITASDKQDGDLTDQIMVAGISKLISADSAKVTYLVFDSDDNMASFTRQIRYTDYRRPVLEITEPLIFGTKDTSLVLGNLRAADVVDGDISDSIRISTLGNTADANVFSVTAQVTNSLGDTTQVRLPVIVEAGSSSRPGIELSEQLIQLQIGDPFNPQNYLQSVNVAGSGADAVEIEHQVDTSTAGTYWVYYRYSDGGTAALAILTVIVQ